MRTNTQGRERPGPPSSASRGPSFKKVENRGARGSLPSRPPTSSTIEADSETASNKRKSAETLHSDEESNPARSKKTRVTDSSDHIFNVKITDGYFKLDSEFTGNYKDLQRDVTSLQADGLAKRSKITELETTISEDREKRIEASNAVTKRFDRVHSSIRTLATKVQDNKKGCEEGQTKCIQASDAVAKRVGVIETSVSNLETSVDDKSKRWAEDQKECIQASDAVAKRVDDVETSISNLETTVDDKSKRWADDLCDKDKLYHKKFKDFVQLVHDNEAKNTAAMEKLEIQLKAQTERADGLSERADGLSDTVKTLEANMSKMRADFMALQADFKALKSDNAAVKNRLAETIKVKDLLDERVVALESAQEQTQAAIEASSVSVKALDERTNEHEASFEAVTRASDTMLEKHDLLERRVDALEAKALITVPETEDISTLRDDFDVLKASHETGRIAFRNFRRNMEESSKQNTHRIVQLEKSREGIHTAQTTLKIAQADKVSKQELINSVQDLESQLESLRIDTKNWVMDSDHQADQRCYNRVEGVKTVQLEQDQRHNALFNHFRNVPDAAALPSPATTAYLSPPPDDSTREFSPQQQQQQQQQQVAIIPRVRAPNNAQPGARQMHVLEPPTPYSQLGRQDTAQGSMILHPNSGRVYPTTPC